MTKKELYIAAVNGRRDFREAYRETHKKGLTTPGVI